MLPEASWNLTNLDLAGPIITWQACDTPLVMGQGRAETGTCRGGPSIHKTLMLIIISQYASNCTSSYVDLSSRRVFQEYEVP